jgi:large exoprotein involved in heme utilization and adhesion
VLVAADQIEIGGGGEISSGTFGPGAAGKVVVTADRLLVVGDASGFVTGINSNANSGSTGNGGQVQVTADELELRNAGMISSATFGAGDGGGVEVTAERLRIVGDDTIYVTGIISSSTAAIRNGQTIIATGNAGEVTVKADELELRDTGEISSSTLGSGSAGRVIIDAGNIGLHDDGQISSATRGPGAAGEVSVKAGRLTVADGGMVQTNSSSSGRAGDISARASRLTVRDDGLVGSSGTGRGPAGNLHLDAETLEVADASIRTEGKVSEGGQIVVAASDLIHLWDAEVTSNGIEPEAGRSVITLEAPLIALNDSRVTSLTGSGVPLAGSGLAQLSGEVTVISADSFVAASLAVTVMGAEGDVGSRLVVPQGVFLNVSDLLRESCAARRSGTASSFTAMGRGGLPPDPAGPLAGSYRELGGTTVAGQAGPVLAGSFGEDCR